jgi:hypothetical protein
LLPVLICIAVPVAVLALFGFVRSQYGDEVLGLGWPPHELNRDDDYRLIKMRLESANHQTESTAKRS